MGSGKRSRVGMLWYQRTTVQEGAITTARPQDCCGRARVVYQPLFACCGIINGSVHNKLPDKPHRHFIVGVVCGQYTVIMHPVAVLFFKVYCLYGNQFVFPLFPNGGGRGVSVIGFVCTVGLHFLERPLPE
jgi:hypothetical protein